VLLAPVHLAVAVSAYKSLPYELEKDLVPVTTVAVFPDVLVAAARVPARTLPELIAYARSNPGKVNCGSAGNGTTRHLACEMFNGFAGIKAEHVPYKGTGPATTALLGGEIDYLFEALGSAAQHIRSGKLKAIAVTSAKRSPSFPEIPTAIQRPYSEFVWPNFRAGRLSVSTQSIDAIDNPPGGPRQAWNLGMKVGLEGQASLVPLYVWMTALGAWLAWSVERARRTP